MIEHKNLPINILIDNDKVKEIDVIKALKKCLDKIEGVSLSCWEDEVSNNVESFESSDENIRDLLKIFPLENQNLSLLRSWLKQ